MQKYLLKGPPGNEMVQKHQLKGPSDNGRVQKHLFSVKAIRLFLTEMVYSVTLILYNYTLPLFLPKCIFSIISLKLAYLN